MGAEGRTQLRIDLQTFLGQVRESGARPVYEFPLGRPSVCVSLLETFERTPY
jgi:hypothetical protein